MPTHIIIFDGVCNLCNGFVQFIIRHDKKEQFQFASLQSAFGQSFLKENKLAAENFDTIIVIKNKTILTHSSAVMEVIKNLSGGWKLFYAFIIIPKPLRDMGYRWLAKNRYRWFGKRETCMLPNEVLKKRFIE